MFVCFLIALLPCYLRKDAMKQMWGKEGHDGFDCLLIEYLPPLIIHSLFIGKEGMWDERWMRWQNIVLQIQGKRGLIETERFEKMKSILEMKPLK